MMHDNSPNAVIRSSGNGFYSKTGSTKQTRDRLLDQYNYMRSLAALNDTQCIMPKVSVKMAGYVMDQGEDVDLWDISVPLLVRMIKIRLMQNVWSHDPIIPVKAGWSENLLQNLKDILSTHIIPEEDAEYLLFQAKTLEFCGGQECAIHGNCTLDNVLMPGVNVDPYNMDGHVWIISPTPPDEMTPSHREVDLGKLLLSCIGMHNTLEAGYPAMQIDMCIPEAMALEEDNSRRLAWIWCAIHHVRLLPVTVDPARNGVIKSLGLVLNMLRNTYDKHGVANS